MLCSVRVVLAVALRLTVLTIMLDPVLLRRSVLIVAMRSARGLLPAALAAVVPGAARVEYGAHRPELTASALLWVSWLFLLSPPYLIRLRCRRDRPPGHRGTLAFAALCLATARTSVQVAIGRGASWRRTTRVLPARQGAQGSSRTRLPGQAVPLFTLPSTRGLAARFSVAMLGKGDTRPPHRHCCLVGS